MVVQALNEIKTEKLPWTLRCVLLELIAASKGVGIHVMIPL